MAESTLSGISFGRRAASGAKCGCPHDRLREGSLSLARLLISRDMQSFSHTASVLAEYYGHSGMRTCGNGTHRISLGCCPPGSATRYREACNTLHCLPL